MERQADSSEIKQEVEDLENSEDEDYDESNAFINEEVFTDSEEEDAELQDYDYDESKDFVNEGAITESEDEVEIQREDGKIGGLQEAQTVDDFFQKLDKNTSNVLCKLCKTELPRYAKKRHLTLHHTMIICEICDKTFPDSKSQRDHLIEHAGLSYECRSCYKRFSEEGLLTEHEKTHSPFLWACVCKQSFGFWDKYLEHKVACKFKASFYCAICKGIFTSEDDLNKHKALDRFNCSSCAETFRSCLSLKQHKDDNCKTPKMTISYQNVSGAWVPIGS